ncbi:MAG: hypothetical protein SFU25_09755 [Candidatus Caenarcaniphilales bacterium]|nr:hypothetical protein [Candidatus Caenarcaniphilales bacterium]
MNLKNQLLNYFNPKSFSLLANIFASYLAQIPFVGPVIQGFLSSVRDNQIDTGNLMRDERLNNIESHFELNSNDEKVLQELWERRNEISTERFRSAIESATELAFPELLQITAKLVQLELIEIEESSFGESFDILELTSNGRDLFINRDI